ncbi:unnamed protein product, partial [Heterotrigona itama]
LDLAGVNAWILYKETTGEQISRKDLFYVSISRLRQLAADNVKSRIELRAAEFQSTSKNSPYSRKWCQIGPVILTGFRRDSYVSTVGSSSVKVSTLHSLPALYQPFRCEAPFRKCTHSLLLSEDSFTKR